MAYIRKKKIAGREYKYLVEGKRVGDKVRQKVLYYLEPVGPVWKKPARRTSFISEVGVQDVETLTDHEKIFLFVAFVLKKRLREISLNELVDAATLYTRLLDLEPLCSWEEIIDAFKHRGWIVAKKGKIHFIFGVKYVLGRESGN